MPASSEDRGFHSLVCYVFNVTTAPCQEAGKSAPQTHSREQTHVLQRGESLIRVLGSTSCVTLRTSSDCGLQHSALIMHPRLCARLPRPISKAEDLKFFNCFSVLQKVRAMQSMILVTYYTRLKQAVTSGNSRVRRRTFTAAGK